MYGKGGLDRQINYIDIVEIPEGMHWTNAHDFIITTGYCFAASENLLELLIRTLIRRGCAGLGIKLGRYLNHIPEHIAEIAESNNFPIIRLPMHLKYRDISEPLLTQLVKEGTRVNDYSSAEEFYYALLHDKIAREHIIRFNSTKFNLPLYVPRFIITAQNVSFKDKMTCTKLASIISSSFKGQCHCFRSEKENSLLAIFQKNDYYTYPKEEKVNIQKAFKAVRSAIHNDAVIAISAPCNSLFEMNQTLYYTNLLLVHGQQLYPNKKTFFFQDHFIELFLFENQNHYILKQIYQTYIFPLLELDKNQHSELVASLEAYCQNSFSITKTAQTLHLHRNTVYNRIKLVESIVGPLDDIKIRQSLLLACKYHQLQKTNQGNFKPS